MNLWSRGPPHFPSPNIKIPSVKNLKKKSRNPPLDSLKIPILREVKKQVEKNFGITKTIKVAKNLQFR